MNKDFQNRNLNGFSFRGQDLTNANFSHADLRGTDFIDAILTNANFTQANLGSQASWKIGIIVLSTISVVAPLFITSTFAGIAIGTNLSSGIFAILFSIFLFPSLLTIFIYTSIRRGLGTAVLALFLTTVASGLGLFLIAVGGGISGFVPMAGAVSVARSLVGGFTGILLANAISAGIVVVSCALIVVGQINRWGLGGIMLLSVGTLIASLPTSVLMSAAMNSANSDNLFRRISSFPSVNSSEFLISQPAPLVLSQLLEGSDAHTVAIAAVSTVIIILIVLLSSVYLSQQALYSQRSNSRIRRFAVAIACRGGTRFQRANLERADFTEAIVKNVDFTQANLTQTRWRHTKLLHYARIERTYLDNPKIRKLVVTGNGQDMNYDKQDLQGVNLRGAALMNASFMDANLHQADLQDANLSNARLIRTQLDSANLQRACLTGAYIKNWGVTKKTQLAKVQCDFVFLGDDSLSAKTPSDRNFKRGEFLHFLCRHINSTDVYHDRDIDPNVAAITLDHLARRHQEVIEVLGIERQINGVSLKIKLPDETRSTAFQKEYQVYYQNFLRMSSPLPEDVAPIALKLEELSQEIKNLHSVNISNLTLNSSSILVTGGSVVVNSTAKFIGLPNLLSSIWGILQNIPPPESQVILEHFNILQKLEELSPNLRQKTAKTSLRILRGITSNANLAANESETLMQLFQQIDQEIFQ
jgi:uncharacterized protein YjbI with pentapeptide repeats